MSDTRGISSLDVTPLQDLGKFGDEFPGPALRSSPGFNIPDLRP